MNSFDVIIVGAGHGGAQAAIALRHAGFAGSIALLGDEEHPPYERPALSKEFLAGEKSFDRLLLRPATFWDERGIHLRTGTRVTEVDPAARIVTTDTGATFGYGKLVWAAGGRPRRLSCGGADLAGVHAIRDRKDVDGLLLDIDGAKRIAVIGGGYIGLEAAAVLTKIGKSVTIIEALDRVLARVAGETLSRFFEDVHRAHGVTLHLNARVARLNGSGGRVSGVELECGSNIPADLVIVGIGIAPNVEPLLAAGAKGEDGVEVDHELRTSLPDIFALGDCARHPSAFAAGRHIRIESVQNANDQASLVARVIQGETGRYAAMPWFWSNQYDLRLQTMGLSHGHDAIVVRGDLKQRSFSIIYLKAGRVIALDCVNAIKDYVQGRALVAAGCAVDPALLGDAGRPLKSLMVCQEGA